MTDVSPGRDTDGRQIVATPAQLFAGMPLGLPSLVVVCAHCDRQLHAGDTVSVYAYRPAEDTPWYLGQSCCQACAPETISAPNPGTAECQLTARLGVTADVSSQQHHLCLDDPRPVAFFPETDGTPP